MAARGLGGDTERNVVPRWRRSIQFAQSPESSSLKDRKYLHESPTGSWAEAAYQDWLRSRQLGLLADAFSAAVVEQDAQRTIELAAAVLAEGDRISKPLQRIALAFSHIESGDSTSEPTNVASLERFSESIVHRHASALRKLCRAEPRNAFHWHDLSYALNLLGNQKGAASAMRAALQVSGSHRLIVRSASRLFLHLGGRREALRVVERAEGVASDPWLLAAHMAIAQGDDRSSKFLTHARRTVEGRKKLPVQFSELGMAVATQEALSGRSKRAKQIIAASSFDPTENALAQGVWLSHRLSLAEVVSPVANASKRAYEAESWSSFYKGDWAAATQSSIGWLIDEPFSKRPAVQASFLASTFLRDHTLAETLARFGLRLNPGEWGLRNNLVVALAEQNRVREALAEFSMLSEPLVSEDKYPTYFATSGLLAYRMGDVEGGRALYQKAMDYLLESKNRSGQMLLTLFQCLEEIQIGNFEQAGLLRERLPVLPSAIGRDTAFVQALEKELLAIESPKSTPE